MEAGVDDFGDYSDDWANGGRFERFERCFGELWQILVVILLMMR